MDTVKKLIARLNKKGITCAEIARRVKYHESAITKVMRDKQDDLPYSVGKRIEKIEIDRTK